MHRMKSELHILDNQVEGLICKWKRYDKDRPTDNNALPATTNSSRTETYVEA